MNLCQLVDKRRIVGDERPRAWLAQPIWARKLECEHILAGHEGCVNTIHWNEDGTRLVSGSDDRRVNIWHAVPGTPVLLRSLPTLHQHNIFDAKFRPFHENVVYTAAADGKVGSVDVVDQPTPRLLYTAYSGIASKIDFQPQSASVFLATFGDGGVRLFDVRLSKASLGAVVLLKHGVTAVQFMPNHAAALFAIGADDPYLRLCDLRKRPPKPLDAKDETAVVATYTTPHLTDPALQAPCYSMRAGHPSVGNEVGISGVAWAQCGRLLAANYRQEDLVLFDLRTFHPTSSINGLDVDTSAVAQVYKGRVNSQTCAKEVNFCFEDTHLCTGGDCGAVYIFDVQSGALRRKLAADRCVVNCVAPHPTLPILASSGIDREIKVWGVGQEVAPDSLDLAASLPQSHSRNWQLRMTENASNVTAAEARTRLATANALKQEGNDKVRVKSWSAAIAKYKLAIDELHFISPSAAMYNEQMAVRRACQLNMAHCHLHSEQYREARDACTAVLQWDPDNVKALFRRATAFGHLKEYSQALRDVELALQLEPSPDLQRLRHTLQQQDQQRRKRERAVFRGLFGSSSGSAAPGPTTDNPMLSAQGDSMQEDALQDIELDVTVRGACPQEAEESAPPPGAPGCSVSITENNEVLVAIPLPSVEDISDLDLGVSSTHVDLLCPPLPRLTVRLPCSVDPESAKARWVPTSQTVHVILSRIEHMVL